MNLTKKQINVMCGGRFITMQYIKKDGTARKLNGRLGVVKHVKGTGRSRKTNAAMITLYENKVGYRSLYIEKIQQISFNGMIIK